MYEIRVNAISPIDLAQFFEVTKTFGKKFYTMRAKFKDEDNPEHLIIHAMAISRDLTYILEWTIEGKWWMNPEAFESSREEWREKGERPDCISQFPVFNIIPEGEWECGTLYPSVKAENDWRNCFYWNNFILVGDMRSDGQTIS